MTTLSHDPLGSEVYRRIARLLDAKTSDFKTLVRLAELDPARDFRHADLSRMCMAGADLRGFDFSFSDFRSVDLTDALIAGTCFERADLAGTDFSRAEGFRKSNLDLAIIQDAPFAPVLVVIPAGSFSMGSPRNEKGRTNNEDPQHRVTFARPFGLGRYAVTFAQYDYFCTETRRGKPEDEGWGREQRPVINVSWSDAWDYCAWLSEVTKQLYRLPSEAEWEYACRAGTETPYWTGETISNDDANFDWTRSGGGGGAENSLQGKTTPVGAFPANPWGLHDMHGNVWEWCADHWRESYTGASDDTSAWLEGDHALRVVRGGAWNDASKILRSACRDRSRPDDPNDDLGFRVCRLI